MPTKQRKIEVHRLTISGLSDGTAYGAFIKGVRQRFRDLGRGEWKHGDKTHALKSAAVHNSRLRLRFYTYKGGFRPDVIDTNTHTISDSPYEESQAGLEYTHALGGRINGRYVLLVEKTQGGLWPRQMETYLQWLVDEFHQPEDNQEDEEAEPVAISLEPDPSEEFIARMDSLDRITKATVRTVRPNPGWSDLESELADQSQASDSHKTEVSMAARRNRTLSKTAGIVQAIRDLFRSNDLHMARVEGKRGNESDSFSTEKLNKFRFVRMEINDDGQVSERSAWETLANMMDSLREDEQARAAQADEQE